MSGDLMQGEPTRDALMLGEVLRYTAFSTDPAGGNRAGVVLDARALRDDDMQRIAAVLGYSESAFLSPRPDGELDVRYFSPLAEVTFCGHATIAAMVAYARRHGAGDYRLHTRAGLVPVSVDADAIATLTSVAPRVQPLPGDVLDALLAALRWQRDDLDPALPPAVAFAGASHPVIAVKTHARLRELDYDFDRLGTLMARHDWTTVALVWREDSTTFHARNPFPPGGVVEDPATGAAAAALGAYLREQRALPHTRRFVIHQGTELGRPSLLTVDVPDAAGQGVHVSGAAVRVDAVDAVGPASPVHEIAGGPA